MSDIGINGVIGLLAWLLCSVICLFTVIYFLAQKNRYTAATKGIAYFMILLVLSLLLAFLPDLLKTQKAFANARVLSDRYSPYICLVLLFIGFRMKYGKIKRSNHR